MQTDEISKQLETHALSLLMKRSARYCFGGIQSYASDQIDESGIITEWLRTRIKCDRGQDSVVFVVPAFQPSERFIFVAQGAIDNADGGSRNVPFFSLREKTRQHLFGLGASSCQSVGNP